MTNIGLFWISLLYIVYIFDVCIGIETIWRTETWQASNPKNISCNPNDSDCIIQCSTEFACGSMENSIKPYIKCPQNDECNSCIINCIEDSSCNNNIILSGHCKKVEINLQKTNNKNMWIRAPNHGNLYINLISDEAMFDNNYIYSSSNTNNIILDCSGNSCQRNIIYGELIQNSLNISCNNGNNCDQQEIHCPDNNKHHLNPKCNVLCDTNSSCYDLNIFAMNGTRKRNGVSFNCMPSSNCDSSRVHCRDNGLCTMQQHKLTNQWHCNGICSDDDIPITTLPPSSSPSISPSTIYDPNLSNTTNFGIIIDKINNQTIDDDDEDNGSIFVNVNNDNSHNQTNSYMVLAYLLLGCVIGGCSFCICIVCIISCIIKNRMIRQKEFEERQQQQQHNEASLSYTPTKDSNNSEIDDIEMNGKPDIVDFSQQKSESLTTKSRKRKNTLTAASQHTSSHKRKQTTFGSMVISEMKDTIAAIAGLEPLKTSTSMGMKTMDNFNINIPPKPKLIRHSTSDPRYGQKDKKRAKQLVDRARMKRIEQSLNEDLNINPMKFKTSSNAATYGSSRNTDPILKDNQDTAKQLPSKPLKYNSRCPMNENSPTKDGLQRMPINNTDGLATDFDHLSNHRLNLNPKALNVNLKHRVNQSHPILLTANQSITVSTRHAYNISNDTRDELDTINSSSSSTSSGSEETSDTAQQSSSSDNDDDDNSSQSSSETSDDSNDSNDSDDTITTATTRTRTIGNLAPSSVVPSDINSIHLPPPPNKSQSSASSGSSKSSKSRHHRSRRIKKQFSIAKSPKMDDIPEEQDLEMTPSATTRHNETSTRSTTLKLGNAIFSNDSRYSKYSQDTEGTNISGTDDYVHNGHQQYQTMVFHDDKQSSTETSTNSSNTTITDINDLHKKIQTMNRKLQETHSDNHTTYTDTMTMTLSTNALITSDTANTAYSSD